MLSIDLCQLLESRGMISVIKCLNNLSKRNLIKLFWIVKNNTALEHNFKVICDTICILTKTQFISKQYLPINFTCKQIVYINLPGILNQRDVKQALSSNLNYNDSLVLTYKFSNYRANYF